jgi:hypothetical protein
MPGTREPQSFSYVEISSPAGSCPGPRSPTVRLTTVAITPRELKQTPAGLHGVTEHPWPLAAGTHVPEDSEALSRQVMHWSRVATTGMLPDLALFLAMVRRSYRPPAEAH